MDSIETHTHGLTEAEAKERAAQGKANLHVGHSTKSYREIFLGNLLSLFNVMILGVVIFILFFHFKTGDIRLALDSIGVLLVAVLNTAIAIFQEIKAKRALDKVRLLLKKKAVAIRDGIEREIDAEEIVVDDVLALARGDQAQVDGIVVETRSLEIDESLLTGESLPIVKAIDEEVLSGSFCVSGRGLMRVTRVGKESYAYSVTGMAKKFKLTLTPLQKSINFLIKTLFLIALTLVILELGREWLKPTGIAEADFVRKIATILISLIPQGLVLISSVSFALGVYRISKLGAIVQKLNAIESFSHVQVVCMDKTGTLTENRLRVVAVTPLSPALSEAEARYHLGTIALHSAEKNATTVAMSILPAIKGSELLEELPFSSATKYAALRLRHSPQSPNGAAIEESFMFGGSDLVAEWLSPEEKTRLVEKSESLGLGEYRNLLLARLPSGISLESLKEAPKGLRVEAIALLSISDTVRAEAREAIDLFRSRGIALKILSGDASESIVSILRELGWAVSPADIATGREIELADEETLGKIVLERSVFARLKPEHKLSIIKAIRRHKLYAAMIGDGVNDLPAIKEADMGIAMEEGSGITKEIADIVLLKNKFSLLPSIFEEGNKIVNSVNAIAKLFLTKNFLVALMSVLALSFLLPFPLTPRRVSLINLFGLGLPSLILALANGNKEGCKDFMKELFSYVFVSSLAILGIAYATAALCRSIIGTAEVSSGAIDMAMMSVLVTLFVVNFTIIGRDTDPGKKRYVFFGLALVGVFAFLASFSLSFFPFDLIKIFYEIDTLPRALLIPILGACFVGTGLLILLQWARKALIRARGAKPSA